MSQAHHAEPDKGDLHPHSVKYAIWIGVGAIALVVAIVLLAQFAIGAYGARSLENDPAMSPEALAKRVGPVAKLQVEGAAPVAPAAEGAKVAAVVAPPAKPAPIDGKKVYDTACMACHTTGAAGAPKVGDKAAWASRLKSGNEPLYAAAIKGKGAMPAKGGFAALSEADVKAAVDFMIAGSK